MFNSLLPSLFLFIFANFTDSSKSFRLVPVELTPEPGYVELTIQYPEDDELKNSLPILVQVRVEGYPLGIETEIQRRKEIRACNKGQTIRVVVDDNPYILLNEDNAPTDAFDNHDAYFRQSVETKIKSNIKQGDHLIRVYPAYSYGEAVRGDGCFNASTFCFKKSGISKINIKDPMITYNEPQGVFSSSQPVLLDFLTHNCSLSKDGYKVRLIIDGKMMEELTNSLPYYMHGLSKGSHTIKLELIDRSGKAINKPFTSPSRTITIR